MSRPRPYPHPPLLASSPPPYPSPPLPPSTPHPLSRRTSLPHPQVVAESINEKTGGVSLYLLGMMGSGKSTVGSILAKELGYYFFDTDDIIEQLNGKTVAEIFEEEGEEE